MAIGNYGQQERNKWRYQYASKSLQLAWDELFHRSANSGFDNTKAVLVSLLSTNETFNNDVLDSIIGKFVEKCENDEIYPWNYYYVKYPAFRPGSYGKLSNAEAATKPYLYSVMQTKSQLSQNSYMPYLKEVDDANLSRDDMGQCLIYANIYLTCENDSYMVYSNDDRSVVDRLPISQNSDGVDVEDRIVKLKEYISNIE